MTLTASDPVDQMHGALLHQKAQCVALGSDVYGDLLLALANDYAGGGPIRSLLDGRFERPIHDAAPLRLMGAVHALALSGRAPAIASHYPSCGGTPHEGLFDDFLAAVTSGIDEVQDALSRQVQTNEVGRSVVHLAMAHWLGRRGVREFDHLEIGASAGLNLNFDRFFADTGVGTMGDTESPLRFGPEWFDVPPPAVATPARIRSRRGCDPYPIDATNPAQASRLLSFVWPDQVERFARTRAAIDIARRHPPMIAAASADEWTAGELARPRDAATVVFHSIVWQYLGKQVQDSFRASLNDAGSRATADAPLYWIRMEPAGPVARVTATEWRGGDSWESVLCEVGYHGRDMRWFADAD